MRKILFVDDEPRILSGIERALRSKRSSWDMRFANGAADALEKMKQTEPDVIVTDFRMPGMDGARLLQRVQVLYPGTVRIMLSGQFDHESGVRVLPVAHQFLSKPCEPAVIANTVERACRLGDLVSNEVVKRVSSAIGVLPPNPEVYTRLTAAIADPKVNLEWIASIVEEDMSVTMKVLQLANSAFFSPPQKVASIPDAIRSLGFDLLRQMALTAEVFGTPEAAHLPAEFSRADLQARGLRAAQIAREILSPPELVFASSVAALLHDVGRLVLAQELPEKYASVMKLAREKPMALPDAERQILGVSHTEVGAYVTGMWGFPDAVVDAILNHHGSGQWLGKLSETLDETGLHDVAPIVSIASALADAKSPEFPVSSSEPLKTLRDGGWESCWNGWLAQAQCLSAEPA